MENKIDDYVSPCFDKLSYDIRITMSLMRVCEEGGAWTDQSSRQGELEGLAPLDLEM